MRVYIQTDKKGEFFNINAFVAFKGFEFLGWEICKFFDADDIKDNDPEIIIVGGIGNVRKRLVNVGIKRNAQEIDYPGELKKYLGRNVWSSTLHDVFQNEQNWNIFIKPKDQIKKFTGKIIKNYKDFIGLASPDEVVNIWCSEIVEFVTEWRCFIRYGQILDIRQYAGVWDSKLDVTVVKSAVRDFKNAPAAYALDFGIDKNGEMKLVEVNDGYSLGCYGMLHINYAKFLSARWAELTNTKDYLNF